MSDFAGFRLSVATALSAAPDIRGHAHRPPTPAVGDAWPLLSTLDRAAGTAFLATWRVRIVLPQDEEAASTWLDAHWPPLFYALERLGFVSRAVPVMLAVGGGEMYALEITLVGED